MTWLMLAACTGGTTLAEPPPTVTETPPTVEPSTPVGTPLLDFGGTDPPRNVLMFSIDTLRKDALGRYGGGDLTPFLDTWLDLAVVLDDHQQCSNWTYASTSCTLNGLYHEDNGFLPKLGYEVAEPFPDGQRTIAGELAAAGYATWLVSTNEWLSQAWNNAQGYQQTPFYGYTDGSTLTQRVFDDLQLHLDAGVEAPWFVHVHWLEPHVPYTPPSQYVIGEDELDPLPGGFDLDTQPGHYEATSAWPEMTADEQALLEAHLRVRYDGEVRWIDDQLQTLVAELGEAGWLDDTLIVLWTDHGEQFWDHGQQSHAHTLHAEENDGVLAFWAPGLVPRSWDQPTHAIDLMPSILAALELEVPPERHGLPVGTAPADRATFTSVSARQGVMQGVTADDFKLLFHYNGRVQLFDRGADPHEATDLYAPDHPRVADLWAQLLPHIDALQPLVPEHPVTWPTGLPTPP